MWVMWSFKVIENDADRREFISVCHRNYSFILGGCSGVVIEYRTRNRDVASSTNTRSTASNLEQVANLLCAQANSTSYPRRDGKWVVATRFSQKLSSLELLPLSTTNRKRYSKKVQVQCVDLSDYNIIFEPNLVQSSNTTLSTRQNG